MVIIELVSWRMPNGGVDTKQNNSNSNIAHNDMNSEGQTKWMLTKPCWSNQKKKQHNIKNESVNQIESLKREMGKQRLLMRLEERKHANQKMCEMRDKYLRWKFPDYRNKKFTKKKETNCKQKLF